MRDPETVSKLTGGVISPTAQSDASTGEVIRGSGWHVGVAEPETIKKLYRVE